MRSKSKGEAGLGWPASREEALPSLATHSPPNPCPTSSGFGCVHGTSTTSDGLDTCGSDVAGFGCSARQASVAGTGGATCQDDVPDLIGTVSWMDHTGMRVELNFLPAWDAGPRRRWARQMLVDALRGSDSDDGGCSGVREPASSPPALGPGGTAMVVPYGEADPASALLMV